MTRFIEGWDRRQCLLLPNCVDDYVGDDSPVRVVDAFIDELDLPPLGFRDSAATGRPGYHPATLLKLYLYGYLNQVQSSRKLEREAGRNVEVMWLTGKLAPDFKTIADFRRDNGAGHPCRMSAVRGDVQASWPCRQRHGCRGRQPLQGGEHARQELHARCDPPPDGAGRRKHRTLPRASSIPPTGRRTRRPRCRSRLV